MGRLKLATPEQIVITTEVQVLPTGCSQDDYERHTFALTVKYRGRYEGKSGGGYSVSKGSWELNRTSREWGYPEKFRRWQFRYPTLEEALQAAKEVVDDNQVNGRTFAQWVELKNAQIAEQAANG